MTDRAAPKIHLLDISEPLLCFCNLKCRCGVVIRNAEPVYMFMEGFLKSRALETVMPRSTCQGCLFLEPVGEARRHYIYGLTEAQIRKYDEAA